MDETHELGQHQDDCKSWPTAKLKYVARFAYGDSLSSTDGEGGPVPVFGSNGAYATTAEPNTLSPVIVVGRKGSYGKVNWSSRPVFASDTTFFIDRTTTEHDLRWLFWTLQNLGLDTTSDDAAVPGLNRENAYSQPVALPPLETQRAIADFLDAETTRIDALIAAKENLLAILAEKRRALVTQAVTRGLDPSVPMRDSGTPWLGEIPAHWEVTRLKFLLEGIEQGWSPQCDNYPAGPGDWGVMKSGCVNGGVFREDENKRLPDDVEPAAQLEILPGDVLISRASGSPSLLGSVARAPESIRSRLLFSDLLYRLKPAVGCIEPDFLVDALSSGLGRTQIRMAISSTGGLANKLPQTNLREFVLTVPPLEEQRRLVASLRAENQKIDGIAEATQHTLDLLRERREAVIAAAVTGQLDVEVA